MEVNGGHSHLGTVCHAACPTCSQIKQHHVPSQKAWLHTSVILLGSMNSDVQALHTQLEW